ncbi:polysaccharide deacetylase family protein [Arthrobacter sp. H5]|uniref:polysaccharide deacetylase family protein n=1 Tax=Arthrobacter sp. H5 TaxID=1267973 RepID=UPI0004B93C96|nr:polysaccharide deacetylase family protein [Arthrobacter sp. H5]
MLSVLLGCLVAGGLGTAGRPLSADVSPAGAVGLPETVAARILPMRIEESGDLPVIATWEYLDGAGAYNKAVDELLLSRLDAYKGSIYYPAIPTEAVESSTGLSVSVRVTGMSGRLVTFRVSEEAQEGAPRSTVFTTDLDTGTTHEGQPPQPASVLSAVFPWVDRRAADLSALDEPAPPGRKHINCDLVPCVALTYDDGPNHDTLRLLEILRARGVHATFFQQGVNIAASPDITKAVADAGHTVANHTYTHADLGGIGLEAVRQEVLLTAELIKQQTGRHPGYFRPPYGTLSAEAAAVVNVPVIMWSVDSQDWLTQNKDLYIPQVMEGVHPGAIVLMHDIHSASVDGQDELIGDLLAKGYYAVTLAQLFEGIELSPGAIYYCRGPAASCTQSR